MHYAASHIIMDNYSYLSISAGNSTGVLDLFVAGTEEVYVITPVDRGWRFSRVTRRGSVSVTVADGRLLSGARILDALRIAAACPGGGPELFEALKTADIPVSPLRAPDDLLPSASQIANAAGTAVRHFLSGRDIERMLSFPAQKTTAPYARTVIAPATAAMRPVAEEDASIARVDSPVERRYAVIYPEGVRPSSREANAGDEITLTYFAEGFKEASNSFIAGKPSPFVEYDGAAIRVRPLSDLGIKLEPIAPPAAPAPKPDTVNIKTTAESAPDRRTAAPAADASRRTVSLVMRFSDDRIVRAAMTIEKDSSEYRLLRAGTFHGRRARRLAVKTRGDESYLIDLRDDAQEPEPTPAAAGKPDETTPADTPRRRKRSSSGWLWVLLTFVAIGLGIVAVSYLPDLFAHVDTFDKTEQGVDIEDTDVAPISLSEAADTLVVARSDESDKSDGADRSDDAVTETVISPDADFEYFNRSNIWCRDSLHSTEALAVFDSFATGNLGAIPAVPFFASGKCTNQDVLKTVRLIWQAKGSQTQTGNERALRRLQGAATIDFNALFKELAGIRPANPNNRPLPSITQ